MSDVVDKIRSRGHWDVAIRPEPFVADRANYAELHGLLEAAAVRLRGWPVPFIDRGEQPLRGDDWIGQEVDASIVQHYEAWRFFTSGQFVQLRAVSADWREGREATLVPEGADAAIEVWEILFYVTEVFELAARLALGPAGDKAMTLDVALNGLSNRALVVGQSNRAPFMVPPRTTAGTLRRTVMLSRDELVGDARGHARGMARELFVRFGWEPSAQQLADHQGELNDGS